MFSGFPEIYSDTEIYFQQRTFTLLLSAFEPLFRESLQGESDRVSPGYYCQIYVFQIPFNVLNPFKQKTSMLLTSAFEPPV